MAAEALVSPVVETLLSKLGSLAYQELYLIWGVEDDLKKLQTTLTTVKAVLSDAEEQQRHNCQVTVWLEALKDVCFDAEDVFDEIEAKALRRQVIAKHGSIPRKVCSYLSWPKTLSFRFKIGHKIKEIREKLDDIASNRANFDFTDRVASRINVARERETHSFVIPSEIIGRDEDKEEVINLLMHSSCNDKNVPVIPIVGIAGLGKTTLAKLVYNDERIDEYFDLKLWVCVSTDFVEKKIIIDIIQSATGHKHNDMTLDHLQKVLPYVVREHNDMALDQLQKALRDVVRGKKHLLVMDDVWNEDAKKWIEFKELLLGGANGSKILVTTRSNRVASIMGTMKDASSSSGYHLRGLPYDECLSLFIKCAFKEGEEKFPNLIKIGGEIVKKCGGVPLAVKTLGSLLYSSDDENDWKYVRDNELWSLEQNKDDILPALKLSYDQLPSYLKQCFVCCSLFPKGQEFTSFLLIQFWMAQGLLSSCKENEELENIGMRYLKELFARSFFQDSEEVFRGLFTFKMHDLMHDLALLIAKNECAIVNSPDLLNSKRLRHVSLVDDNMVKDGVPSFFSSLGFVRTIMFHEGVIPSQSFIESCISMFPFLRYLDLNSCDIEIVPKKIGNLRHLRYLDLGKNKKIKELPKSIYKLQSLQTLMLHGCVELQELPRDIRYLISLRCLVLATNKRFLIQNTIGSLNSLRLLIIDSCKNLESLVEDIGSLKALCKLVISDCPNLLTLPSGIICLSSLEVLCLLDCEKLNIDCRMGMEEGNLNSTRRPHLQVLTLLGLPQLVELPQWLLQCCAKTLQWLAIDECPNFLALPDSMPYWESLLHLHISNCPEVSSLPQDMHCLTTLREIGIEDCPTLSRRCHKDTGEDWPKIAHVSTIKLDGKLIEK